MLDFYATRVLPLGTPSLEVASEKQPRTEVTGESTLTRIEKELDALQRRVDSIDATLAHFVVTR